MHAGKWGWSHSAKMFISLTSLMMMMMIMMMMMMMMTICLIQAEYSDLFSDELGKLPVTYSMTLDPDMRPVVRPAHRVPMAMKDRVKAELDRMQDLGVITPVSEPTDWVSSMVATNKKDKQEIRIRINPRDLNTVLKRPHHPMRNVEEVAVQMSGATVFLILDAKSSFWQISLNHRSSMLTTFSTPFGRYRFLRMPFGLNSASEVFQCSMEQIFTGYPCAVIVDDILIGGKTIEEHDANMRKVLNRAREMNLRQQAEVQVPAERGQLCWPCFHK